MCGVFGAFSPDGKKLATSSQDKTVKIWDLELGQDVLTLGGFSPYPGGRVIFSPDGKKLATWGTENLVKIWDLTLEGWLASPVGKRKIAGLITEQLNAYNLSGLLDIRPQNEQLLLETKNTYQIAAFADLYAQKIAQTGFPKKDDYARATRLYQACLDSGDCMSTLCGDDGSNMYCVEPCTPGAKETCPDEFHCVAAASAGMCWPGAPASSGCQTGNSTGSFAAALALLACMSVLRRRRA